MACTQTLGGLVNDCMPSKGGILEAYVANHADVGKVQLTDEKISAITMTQSAKFHRYYFRPQTSQFTSTLTVSPENGTTYVSTAIVLSFTRMDATKRAEMAALSLGELAVIVKDANGKYWYFGKDEPVMANAGDGQTGTARGDKNGYSITLQDNSETWPYEVDASIIDGLLA